VSPAIAAPQQDHVNFPNIKSERGYEPPPSAYPAMPAHLNGYTGGFSGDIAQQRAQALVAQRRAHAPPNGMQMPPQQQGLQPQHPQQPGQIYNSQTDGSDGTIEDWNALMAARSVEGDDGPSGRIAADNLMRTRIDAMMANHENGLGMPLSDIPKGRKRKAVTRVRQRLQANQAEASSSSSSTSRVAPFDGEEEKQEEEDPDDAINSDLDDPEDELNDGNGSDDDMVDYMLCTYDKVQRVKNKWKCTLKDGILTTNKKEYLFHKATGEFEW
jgi:transcription initiation factor TFIIA large subunit